MSGPEPNILIFPLFSFSLWFSFLSRFHTHCPGIVTLIENYTLVSTVSPGKHTLHVCQDSLFARCRLTNRGRQQEKKRHALLFETQSRLQSQFMHCRYIRWQEYRFNSVFIWGNQEVGAPAPYFRLAWDSTSACNTQCQSSCISEDEGTPSFLLLLPLELDKCSSKVALELSGTFIVFFSTSAHTWHQGLHGMVTVTSETWLLLSNNAYFLLSAEFLRGFSTKSGLRKFLKADIPLEAGFRFSLFGS